MKVIFLDRDGVINKYPGHKKYVTRLRDFKILPGALAAIQRLTEAGYQLYVISNQAGVTKGLYTKKELMRMTDYMLEAVSRKGGRIHSVLYCLHTKEMNCRCRKPKDGLLRQAVKGQTVDRKNSYFIGDSLMDVAAGRTFGCKTILVFSGREKSSNVTQWDIAPDFVAKNLNVAAKNIVNGKYDRA